VITRKEERASETGGRETDRGEEKILLLLFIKRQQNEKKVSNA
jgi:hypothetical protein